MNFRQYCPFNINKSMSAFCAHMYCFGKSGHIMYYKTKSVKYLVAYAMNFIRFYHLITTQHWCLYPCGRYDPPLATHAPFLTTLLYVPFVILQ